MTESWTAPPRKSLSMSHAPTASVTVPESPMTGGVEPRIDPKASSLASRAAHWRSESEIRRGIDPTTGDHDRSAAETEFMHAMQEYKRSSGRKFPTWSEVLEVLKGLGYEKSTAA
jgi:hypothetical protein